MFTRKFWQKPIKESRKKHWPGGPPTTHKFMANLKS